jgi:hypothetical protein
MREEHNEAAADIGARSRLAECPYETRIVPAPSSEFGFNAIGVSHKTSFFFRKTT